MTWELFFILLFVWTTSAVVAGAIAFSRGRSPILFGVVTFFFLGPVGPGFALIAPNGFLEQLQLDSAEPAKRKIAEGRQRFTCPRCGAENDIPDTYAAYDCWRCSEHRKVKPKVAKTT